MKCSRILVAFRIRQRSLSANFLAHNTMLTGARELFEIEAGISIWDIYLPLA